MFGSILGRKKEEISTEDKEHQELVEKISKMNLTEMRSYINGKIKEFEVSEDGLNEVLSKLVTPDTKTKNYYVKADDMDSKKKKAFDLVLNAAKNKKVNVVTVELMQKFMDVYKDIIAEYDKEHKEIYESRFRDAIELALKNITQKSELKNKMDVLQQN
jgi:ribosomal protein L7/L12